ncbi:hypothetical protein PSAN_57050 [Pseudomonas antarctica]|uniref:Uncharacterized protein n=1 Tax=Pseudomonas antarctica TaxID=219572 RepID=A0ABQ6ZN29_9PSED|nr:hypothetical protein PSAN_57050 [Pseudomonas antarctica]
MQQTRSNGRLQLHPQPAHLNIVLATALSKALAMPSVSKEVRISMTELDATQRHLRMCISPLEILGNTRPDPRDKQAMARMQLTLKAEHRQIRVQWVGMARALKSGFTERLDRPAAQVSDDAGLEAPVQNALDGYRLLTLQLAGNVDAMRQRLAKTASHWKI